MKALKLTFFVAFFALAFSSCTMYSRSMKEPNTRVEFSKNDFELSGQVTAEATSVKVLMIDWARLFTTKEGYLEGKGVTAVSIPVVGPYLQDKTSSYALYELMNNNDGYDVVFYPTFEKKTFTVPFLYSQTKVKVTARMGKLK